MPPTEERVSTTARRRLVILLYAIAAAGLIVDQSSKAIAVLTLEGRPGIPVIGNLAGFTFYRNPGAAFGMGANTTWLFAVIGIVVFAVVLWLSRRLASRGWAVALGLLLAGLLGNLSDRLFRPPGFFRGAVVDFIDLSLFICNLADVAITAAATLMIVLSFRGVGISGPVPHEQETKEEELA